MLSIAPEQPRVLYEDHHLIAVDKPAGIVVHAGTGHATGLVEQVRELLAARHGSSRQWAHVAPVHRLDKQTSGVVVFGKTEAGLRKMARLFETGEIEKSYLVLAKGITHKKGKIDVPLLARPESRGERRGAVLEPAVDDESLAEFPVELDEAGKSRQEALTTYRRLIFVRGASLLVVQPKTGRTHQIRRHLRSIAHPVGGDDRWGDKRFNHFLARHGLHRPFIHAAMLSFPHPVSREPVVLRSVLPDELLAVLNSLGFAPLRAPWGPAPAGSADEVAQDTASRDEPTSHR